MRFFHQRIKNITRTSCLFLLLSFIFGCSPAEKARSQTPDFTIRFLSEYVIPFGLKFKNTTIGGLSGIDYDPSKKIYYAISDDRSAIDPARFYSLDIQITDDVIDTVIFLKHIFLKNAAGQYFPPAGHKRPTVDPESIRYRNGQIIWSSEGERIVNATDTVLLDPQIFLADMQGNYVDTFVLPRQLRVTSRDYGVRQNGGFEGLAVSPGGKYLFASVEEPLLQDGPRAGLNDSFGMVRIIKFDLNTRRPVAQYAYQIEPVAHPVHPPSAFRLNGISEILCLDDDRLLVVERSYSSGRLSCTIRVYIADLSKADDVSQFDSLKDQTYKPAPKKLVINMDNLGRFTDNIEGVTFGPKLSNGKRSLIFIADDNFVFLARSQVFLFEIDE